MSQLSTLLLSITLLANSQGQTPIGQGQLTAQEIQNNIHMISYFANLSARVGVPIEALSEHTLNVCNILEALDNQILVEGQLASFTNYGVVRGDAQSDNIRFFSDGQEVPLVKSIDSSGRPTFVHASFQGRVDVVNGFLYINLHVNGKSVWWIGNVTAGVLNTQNGYAAIIEPTPSECMCVGTSDRCEEDDCRNQQTCVAPSGTIKSCKYGYPPPPDQGSCGPTDATPLLFLPGGLLTTGFIQRRTRKRYSTRFLS